MHSSLGLPDTVIPQSDSGASVRRLLAYGKKCRPYYSLIGRKSSRKKVKKTKKQKKWKLVRTVVDLEFSGHATRQYKYDEC